MGECEPKKLLLYWKYRVKIRVLTISLSPSLSLSLSLSLSNLLFIRCKLKEWKTSNYNLLRYEFLFDILYNTFVCKLEKLLARQKSHDFAFQDP